MTEQEKSLPFSADFPAATREQWRKLVDAVLKGAPFNRLESRTRGGLTIEPLYEPAAEAQPVAGRSSSAAWTLMQRVDQPDPAAANAQALDDLENGAKGLALVFAGSVTANGFGVDGSAPTIERLLEGVYLDAGVVIDLNLSQSARDAARAVAALIKSSGVRSSSVDLRPGINPVGGFAVTGRTRLPWPKLSQVFASLVGEFAADGFRGPYAVADGRIIHNAGGSEAQELAFALACAVLYLRALEASGMTLEAARDAVYFRLSADAEQFLTMAKFRAMRKLWARVEAACGLSPKPALIMAETAWRMMTQHDPYSNVLRTTVAVAAAGLGGADSISVLPHTAAVGLSDGFARRVARNTQLVLLEESNLARVGDPAAGSGALEAITEQVCAAAWSLFQEIEKTGGVWAALESGAIQQKVAAVRAERQKAVARRSDILTGTNDFPNIHENVPTVLYPASAVSPKTDGASPASTSLKSMRLAEPFEQLRDASDKILARSGARPKIFLANLGKPADFTPRATFAKNFFEAGGIEAVSGDGDSAALVAAFQPSGAALACLCGADKSYEGEAAAVATALKAAGARHVYLAGQPGEREAALREAGVQSFIYNGCDALSTLTAAYDILG
ncbi:MAG TPA: methylmalonyl-CoA mutase subunit beta [Xanthobacteraceae bacterium]|nr:methylmalonyl-CoA mutase subunit beta [Xanthobacteraceae bacterium]